MILRSIGQLPNGSRVRIVGIPPGSAWSFLPGLVGEEGIINGECIDFPTDRLVLGRDGHEFRTTGANFLGYPLEVVDLSNDPDGNY